MKHRLLSISAMCVLVALVCIGPSVAYAVTLVADDFEDGDRAKTGALDIDWYSHSHAQNVLNQSIVDDTGALGPDKAMKVEPITSGTSIYGVWSSPITLGAGVGSTLTFSFELRNDNGGAAPGGTFRFGVYDADEADFPVAGGFGTTDGDYDSANPGSNLDVGPWVQQDNTGNVGFSCCTRLFEESGTVAPQHGGGDTMGTGWPANNATFPEINEADGLTTMTLEIERLLAGPTAIDSLLYTYTIDNGSNIGVLSGPNYRILPVDVNSADTFDYVSMFHDGGGAAWMIDNFTVVSNVVPEPASWCLLSMAGLLLGLRRRK